jgi:hypothetical protein
MVVWSKIEPQDPTPRLVVKMTDPFEVTLGDDLEQGVGVVGGPA